MDTLLQQAKRRYKKPKSGPSGSGSEGSAPASSDSSPQTTPARQQAPRSPVTMKSDAMEQHKNLNGRAAAADSDSDSEYCAGERRVWSHRTEATEEENKSRKTLEKAVREETLWRDQPLENEPASKGDGPSKGINKNVVDSIRTKELKRVKRQIQELKFRAQDATRRAEIAWKLREARTASDSFCALFPDKDKVATDAVIYVQNAYKDLESVGMARGGFAGFAVGLARSFLAKAVVMLDRLGLDQVGIRALEVADSVISVKVARRPRFFCGGAKDANRFSDFATLPVGAERVCLRNAGGLHIFRKIGRGDRGKKVGDGTVERAYQSRVLRLLRNQVMPRVASACTLAASAASCAACIAQAAASTVTYVPRSILTLFFIAPVSFALGVVQGIKRILTGGKVGERHAMIPASAHANLAKAI